MAEKKTRRKYSFPVRKEFLSKKECLLAAERILQEGHITGMKQKALAREIYFHAAAFHFVSYLERFHIRLKRIRKAASPIDVADHGDTLLRRFCYWLLWLFPSIRK